MPHGVRPANSLLVHGTSLPRGLPAEKVMVLLEWERLMLLLKQVSMITMYLNIIQLGNESAIYYPLYSYMISKNFLSIL